MKRTTALFTTTAVAASLFAGVAFASGAEAAAAQRAEAVTQDTGPGHGRDGNCREVSYLLRPISEILPNSAGRIDRLINRSHELGERIGRRAEAKEAMVEFLDLSLDEMNEAFQKGSTLGEIAQDQGITIDELTTFIADYASAEITEALADGAITQKRADQSRENLAERIENRIKNKRVNPGQGGGPGNHRP